MTVDLNGFSITGSNKTTNQASGILINPGLANISVRNGTITGFTGGSGITSITGNGAGTMVNSSRFEKLIIAGNANGIWVGDSNEIHDCVVTANSDSGITVNDSCRVTDCLVNNNKISGVQARLGTLVRDCVVRANGGTGISFSGGSRIIGNLCDQNGGDGLYTAGDASRIEGNTATYNGFYGISIGGSTNVIVQNTCRQNGKDLASGAGGVDNNFGGLELALPATSMAISST